MSSAPTTFICCIEYGVLEEGVINLAESVRRLGGGFGATPIIAVTPRWGPALCGSTRDALKKYNVLHLVSHGRDRQNWFKFLNKPSSLLIAEPHIATSQVTWVDSDLLFAGVPELLVLSDDEDFCACASDKEQGSGGEGDAFEPLWRFLSQAADVTFEKLGWVIAEHEQVRMRTYWNGGIFTYRRGLGFPEKYMSFTRRFLDQHVISRHAGFGIGIFEMASIGFAAASLGMRIRALPEDHNYSISPLTYPASYDGSKMRTAKVVHYHNSIWPNFFATFVSCLRSNNPALASWLEQKGPYEMPQNLLPRVGYRALKALRNRQERSYLRSCRCIETDGHSIAALSARSMPSQKPPISDPQCLA